MSQFTSFVAANALRNYEYFLRGRNVPAEQIRIFAYPYPRPGRGKYWAWSVTTGEEASEVKDGHVRGEPSVEITIDELKQDVTDADPLS